MSLSFSHLPTHWDAGEADTVIAFLDQLRDALWATYGDDIIAMRQAADAADVTDRQIALAFDDELDF
jgi:hypothetical protein